MMKQGSPLMQNFVLHVALQKQGGAAQCHLIFAGEKTCVQMTLVGGIKATCDY